MSRKHPRKQGVGKQPASPRKRGDAPRAKQARTHAPDTRFLPMTRDEMSARGWDELDILLISGDAYVDHPSFGVALLGRLLESRGYRVGIIAQPDWKTPDDIARMGRPRLFCGISAGCLDSMLAHYTAFRKKRHDDAYTPGGEAGKRPNRASTVYANLTRQVFPGLPLVLGGIEASLRRITHYDFWSDALRRSLLVDTRADLLLYGMAEQGILEVTARLERGQDLAGIPGSAWISRDLPDGAILLPSFDEITATPRRLLDATLQMEEQVHHRAPLLAQPEGKRWVMLAPPPPPLSTDELDAIYALSFTREAHPSYTDPIPALAMIQHSLTAVRGCGGGCSFCSLALHQGRAIRSRSQASLQQEIQTLAAMPHWRGVVTDIGGPTANAWGSHCAGNHAACKRKSCYAPRLCPHLRLKQGNWLRMLQHLQHLPGVKHLRVASGVRHDLALDDPAFAACFVQEFVGGQLKLAPEHSVDHVLRAMRKSDFALFERFLDLFDQASHDAGKRQYVVPYIMSAFPGCTMSDMRALTNWFREQGWTPQQVQCFIPTPGTVATAMYYAECDADGKTIHVARTDRERQDQHACLVGDTPNTRKR